MDASLNKRISVRSLNKRKVLHNLLSCILVCITRYPSDFQAIYCDAGYQGGGYHPLDFRVRFKISYRVIHRLIEHGLLSKMVYLNVKYVIATRSYDFLNIRKISVEILHF